MVKQHKGVSVAMEFNCVFNTLKIYDTSLFCGQSGLSWRSSLGIWKRRLSVVSMDLPRGNHAGLN